MRKLHITVLAAAEAVEALGLRVDNERGVAVSVEWTPGPVVLSARVQFNVKCDEALDSDGTFELLDFVIVTRRDLFREFSHGNFGYFLELYPIFVVLRCSGTSGLGYLGA
jgi:hypothetical protein